VASECLAGAARIQAKSGVIPALSRNGDAPKLLGVSPVAFVSRLTTNPRMKGGSCARGALAPSSS